VNTAHKGRRAEHRAQKKLEALGYLTMRAAGSKGPIDIIAWAHGTLRFISVKSGTKYVSAIEREALQNLPNAGIGTVEIWRFPDRCREPLIEVL
jgi:Holliday junction resolvase-like predicted endonuclease